MERKESGIMSFQKEAKKFSNDKTTVSSVLVHLLEVVLRARRDAAEEDLLGGASAQRHAHAVLKDGHGRKKLEQM
jgi:hypothetical protein